MGVMEVDVYGGSSDASYTTLILEVQLAKDRTQPTPKLPTSMHIKIIKDTKYRQSLSRAHCTNRVVPPA